MPDAAGRYGCLPWLWISAVVFILDQLSKWFFQSTMTLYQLSEVIPGYFGWTLAYNTGAAFSFLADGAGWQRWLFALIAIVVSGILVVWLKRLNKNEVWIPIALALVLGGALGNLCDRIVLGHVVDFVLVHWHDRWYFPAFNLADSAITVGAIMLIFDMFLPKRSREVGHA